MIFAYNKEHVGDVLLVIVADDQGAENQVKRVGDVARVSLVEAPETVVAWNIFNASALLGDINGTCASDFNRRTNRKSQYSD